MRATALIFALSTAAVWGIGGILIRRVTDAVSASTILAVQYAVGIVAVAIWLAATSNLSETFGDVGRKWPALLFAVAFQLGGYVCWVLAVKHSGSSSIPTAAVIAIAACYPAVVALLSGPLLDQRLGWHQGLGIGLVVAGVIVSQWR